MKTLTSRYYIFSKKCSCEAYFPFAKVCFTNEFLKMFAKSKRAKCWINKLSGIGDAHYVYRMDFNKFWTMFCPQSPKTQREERRIKVLTEISYNRKYILIWVNILTIIFIGMKIYTSWAYDYHISWNFEHFMRNVTTLVSFQYVLFLWSFFIQQCILFDGFYARILSELEREKYFTQLWIWWNTIKAEDLINQRPWTVNTEQSIY